MLINIIYLISFILINGDVLNASEDIECVPLENCPFAISLLSKTQKILNVINFLNSTKCGEVEGTRKMKVWCNKFINCKTYDKRNGTCLPQENCFELNAILSNERKYFCNIIGKAEQNHVCCPWSSSSSSYSPLIPIELNFLDGNETTKEIKHDEIFQMEISDEEQSTENPESLENQKVEESNEKCVTPDNTSGLCTDIEKCPSFLEKTKVENISDISVLINNLRKYQCEYINNKTNSKIIKVCCPSAPDAKILSSTSLLQDRIFLSEEKRINKCGRQNIDDKITRGSATSLAEFPWIVLLQYESSRENGKYRFGCAGTIINKKWIITAAHCVNADMMELSNFKKLHKIILGEYDTRNETDCFNSSFGGSECADPIQYFNPKRIIEHEDFQTLQPARDIALIELDEEIKFSDYIKPICLPSGSKKASFRLIRNESIFISGWGRTELGESSPIKQKAKVVYLGEDNCNRSLGLNEGQLCLESQNGIDSCKGDSGGPLMHISADKKSGDLITTLVGIISFGIGKCGTNYSVNTYIPYYLDWIANNIT